jgi:hypothetical protein
MTEATAGVERFLSLEELKAKYDDLLKRGVIEKGGTADPHLLDELVPEFIRQACATGTVLEDDAERYAAQGMITYWTSALYRARKTTGARTSPPAGSATAARSSCSAGGG